ncbi:hypothetical protein [Rhizobium leguminosarum]|uniref:hypothetical protein n=1 Tax=Rhizobium leguminosarum TaxID=384 RepID=UPI0010308060|nr:hypothetical protein [Rhizobium leguminosarum]TAU73467.1 hypothetical protein ELI40_30950 [Rhizobium leguminosarum]TAU74050.1 hypothetical protein ELI41_34005 [Rhizobium leguminosarum]TAV42854.1 hypothetical protein ELI29_32690 [Rhizobium leguminosarum]TAX02865.1 hypothetical protein ELI07_31795 [Rhizobium leguminosarum]TAY11474.1 hypothetical protein ELH96_06810 [Rhizobium leguminosarum]
MASPWKLLAGLVSRRRQQKQEHGSTDDVKPDVSAIAKPTETAADNRSKAADRAANEKPVTHEQHKAVSVASHHAEEAVSSVDDTADVESATLEKAVDPALSNEADVAGHPSPKALPVGEGPTRKRSRQSKKAKTIAVVLPPSPGVATVSDDAVSLDGEIRLLRDQLATKLRLQNAQLKRMLDRFER